MNMNINMKNETVSTGGGLNVPASKSRVGAAMRAMYATQAMN
ncbi:MAG: hypothetical protein ACKVIN_11470 [Longimicrobiales bacterium]|jgi:hypothetical protein